MARKLKNRLFKLITERELRLGRRIPQTEVARAVGVSDNTISTWMKNDLTKINVSVVESMCDYFDCDINDLLYFERVETDTNLSDTTP